MKFAANAGALPRNVGSLSFVSVAWSTWTLPGLGVAMAVLQSAGAIAQCDDAVRANIVIILAEGIVYLAAVSAVMRGAPLSLGWMLGVAVALRCTILFLAPYHSNDIYRYVWDGEVQGAGVNPFLYIPNDPALAGLRDASVWPNINRGDYAPTIYPPGAQLLFFLVTRVTTSVIGMKVIWVLMEGVTAGCVIRILDRMQLPRERLLVYAWSPLAVWEIAGSGHLDAAMATFVALAVLIRMRDKPALAGAALGFAVMIKFLPLVALPALWRRWDWRLPLGCVAVAVAGYAIYLGAGAKVFGFLAGYSGEEGLRDGRGFWFVRVIERTTGYAFPPLVYVAAVAIILGCVALADSSRDVARPAVGALTIAATAMIALTPTHPWYFIWLTPLLCVAPSPPLLWLTVVSPLFYWPNPTLVPWNIDVAYGGLCLLLLINPIWRFSHLYRSPRGSP